MEHARGRFASVQTVRVTVTVYEHPIKEDGEKFLKEHIFAVSFAKFLKENPEGKGLSQADRR